MKKIILAFLVLAGSLSAAAQPGEENHLWAPDSSFCAYNLGGDLYLRDASGAVLRLTTDGSDVILNGYASWVYFEEIFGRPSDYRSFWWSPDSKKIAFYRYDDSRVPMFPIYSPFGQDGTLRRTHYPKAGEPNPPVKIGIVDLSKAHFRKGTLRAGDIVWADFDPEEDQYFGIPFWGADSKTFFVGREPRIQNTYDLFAVSAADGSRRAIYHETYKTWLDWPEDMLFSEEGLYMVRAFETGWEQIYFLSYDGARFERLTDGCNWKTRLLRRDPSNGDIYFTSQRDSRVRSCLYRLSPDGTVKAVTPKEYNVDRAEVSEDCSSVKALLSNCRTPRFTWDNGRFELPAEPDSLALPQIIELSAEDGQTMYGSIIYPKDFDPGKVYPVHIEIYGGPGTQYVVDRWRAPQQWWSENGIIHLVADVRSSGHTGRAGTDLVYKNLTASPIRDFCRWATWLRGKAYVGQIGVEGFSFGGTNTALLLLDHSDLFRCGIAGGGVYDWMLYDTHYTERFMSTPADNPEGYADKVTGHVKNYPGDCSSMLRLTHGTGDDNVHFQSTLQLVDELQKEGKQFELMIYPDGMHGYRGAQGRHSWESDKLFWLKYLKNQ